MNVYNVKINLNGQRCNEHSKNDHLGTIINQSLWSSCGTRRTSAY